MYYVDFMVVQGNIIMGKFVGVLFEQVYMFCGCE